MLMFVYPALVTVGAIALRRERADRRRVAALGTAVVGIGVVLVASASAGVDPVGAVFALGAALGYACYLLITEGVVRRTHPIVLTALLTSGAGSAFSAAGLAGVGGGLDLHLSPVVWLLIVVIAVVGTVVPYLGFTRSPPAPSAPRRRASWPRPRCRARRRSRPWCSASPRPARSSRAARS